MTDPIIYIDEKVEVIADNWEILKSYIRMLKGGDIQCLNTVAREEKTV